MNNKNSGVYTYAAFERMMRIHKLLQNEEYPNCTKLSKEFEMSVRTLKRDIDSMKCRLKLPIEFDVRRNGYYYTEPVTEFPQMPISEKDTFALFVASKAIEQYRGTPLQRMLEATFRKLTGQLDQNVRFSLGGLEGLLSFRPFAPGDGDVKLFELLTRAITEKRALRFTYRNHGELKTQRRHVHPYHLAYINNQWNMFGFDAVRSGIRTFVLARLTKPAYTGKRFTISEKFDLNKELSGSLGLYKGKDNHEVVIEFDAFGADDVRGRRWHSSQELTELPKGRLRVKLRLNSLEEVERWVLAFGIHATVVGPKALAERVGRIGRELAGRYEG